MRSFVIVAGVRHLLLSVAQTSNITQVHSQLHVNCETGLLSVVCLKDCVRNQRAESAAKCTLWTVKESKRCHTIFIWWQACTKAGLEGVSVSAATPASYRTSSSKQKTSHPPFSPSVVLRRSRIRLFVRAGVLCEIIYSNCGPGK